MAVTAGHARTRQRVAAVLGHALRHLPVEVRTAPAIRIGWHDLTPDVIVRSLTKRLLGSRSVVLDPTMVVEIVPDERPMIDAGLNTSLRMITYFTLPSTQHVLHMAQSGVLTHYRRVGHEIGSEELRQGDALVLQALAVVIAVDAFFSDEST